MERGHSTTLTQRNRIFDYSTGNKVFGMSLLAFLCLALLLRLGLSAVLYIEILLCNNQCMNNGKLVQVHNHKTGQEYEQKWVHHLMAILTTTQQLQTAMPQDKHLLSRGMVPNCLKEKLTASRQSYVRHFI